MRPRPSGSAIVLALSMLACSPEPSHVEDAPLSASPPAGPPSPPTLPAPDPIVLPPVVAPVESPPPALAPEPEPATPPEPADPLAPILPDGPEPGSPEADAELAKLLDESSITQEEFDKAFRGGGPNIQGDQFVFGAGERSRATPILQIGKLRVESGSVPVADLDAIVRADEHDLLACHAVALMDDPTSTVGGGRQEGSVELRVEFDATGSKSTVTTAGGEALAPSLVSCLITVAESWRPKGAGKAKFAVPLELSTQ